VALNSDGYVVAGAPNGREAIHYLRSHAETCVIVLDLALPVMGGAQFRRAQLQDRSLAWIPVIVMSAMLDADRRARELGSPYVLRKPLDLEEVRRMLRRVGCGRLRLRLTREPPGSA